MALFLYLLELFLLQAQPVLDVVDIKQFVRKVFQCLIFYGRYFPPSIY